MRCSPHASIFLHLSFPVPFAGCQVTSQNVAWHLEVEARIREERKKLADERENLTLLRSPIRVLSLFVITSYEYLSWALGIVLRHPVTKFAILPSTLLFVALL